VLGEDLVNMFRTVLGNVLVILGECVGEILGNILGTAFGNI
jgi:hypothetical protein